MASSDHLDIWTNFVVMVSRTIAVYPLPILEFDSPVYTAHVPAPSHYGEVRDYAMLPRLTMPLSGVVVDTSTMTFVSDPLDFGNRNILALFTLERDEDGDMVFADTGGAMYGVGPDFAGAVEDWLASAKELREELRSHHGGLIEEVVEQLELFDRVLAEKSAIAKP
jgi:hypothetical protein